MSDSNDYEDEPQETTNFCQLERPLFQRKKNADELKIKRRKKVQKPVKKTVPQQSVPLMLVQEDPVIKKKDFTVKPSKARVRERYVEYGNDVGGYKFVITEQEYLKLSEREEEPVEIIDAHSFDCINPKQRTSMSANVKTYWEQSGTLRLPLVRPVTVDEVEIDEITASSVREFYLRSCSQQGIDYSALLKGERVKWHPDRLVGQTPEALRKVTRLFQIINELWESHTY